MHALMHACMNVCTTAYNKTAQIICKIAHIELVRRTWGFRWFDVA